MNADGAQSVAIYAAKTVRGQIIARSLTLCGIAATLDADPRAAVARIEAGEAALLVVDVNNHLQAEIGLLRSLAAHLSGSLLVTHTNPRDRSALEGLGVAAGACLGGPLDPEEILVAVKAFFAAGRMPSDFNGAAGGRRWRSAERTRRIRRQVRQAFEQAVMAPRRGLAKWRAGTRRWSPVLRPVRLILLAAVALSAGATAGYLFWCLSTLPEIDRLNQFSPFKASKLYSHDNQLLAELYEQRRTPVALAVVPRHVRQAFVAVEDARYFQHSGIDPIRIAGALWADLKAGGYHQGGSTITQQLSKMIFLTPEKTITRKVKEMAIALLLERRYSKERILELYLNQVYFGSRAYGLEAAAQAYFGKTAAALSLAEGALLAALPKAPSAYSPFRNPQRARARRDYVLDRMLACGMISKAEHAGALREPLPAVYHGRPYRAPYFVDHCRKRLEAAYGDRLATSGLTVYATLDARLQAAAEDAVRRGVARMAERGVVGVQAALVALALDSGSIKAMVGGTDYARTQFNRATQAMRQPGSAFKPFVYLTALENGFQPDSPIQDEPVTITVNNGRQTWQPRNYTGRFRGEVTLQEALSRSINAATVNLALHVGLDRIIATAHRLGIESKLYPYYPTVLGASEVTLLELTAAYGSLATGRRLRPVGLDRIIDKGAASIWDPGRPAPAVLSETTVAAMRRMLAAVVRDGTARRALCLERAVYGKTGTSNANADALFIGFDEDLVVGVWVGRDDRTPIGPKETGGRAALPIWVEFMRRTPSATLLAGPVPAN